MTVAEKMGVYNGIKDFYSSSKNGTVYNSLDKMDFMDLTVQLGHQKEDFIYEYV
jgi:hypothetical protein